MTAIDLPLFSFDFAMVDPPWPWRVYSENGMKKSPEAQYKTMSFAEIEALRCGDLLAPSGVMWLWCTWPLIHQQCDTLRRWGLEPKTGGAWAKRTESGRLRWGTGYLLRSVCEPFIIATLPGSGWRGSSAANLIETIADAAVDGVAREHSRKPEEVYALVESILPNARKADIFSRQKRPGWTSWGNEVEKFAEPVA